MTLFLAHQSSNTIQHIGTFFPLISPGFIDAIHIVVPSSRYIHKMHKHRQQNETKQHIYRRVLIDWRVVGGGGCSETLVVGTAVHHPSDELDHPWSHETPHHCLLQRDHLQRKAEGWQQAGEVVFAADNPRVYVAGDCLRGCGTSLHEGIKPVVWLQSCPHY